MTNDYHPNKTAMTPCTFALVDIGAAASMAGGVSAPDHDLDGTPRPQNTGFDIGCYEAR